MAVLARHLPSRNTPVPLRLRRQAEFVLALAEDRLEDELISRTGEAKRGSPYEFRAKVSTFTGTKETERLF
jgi:hypothetical protein